MGGEMLFLLAVMAMAVYGVFKYINAETNDYSKLVQKLSIQRGEIETLKKEIMGQDDKILGLSVFIDQLKSEVFVYTKKTMEVEKDVDEAQDHMAKMRDSQAQLRDRSYPRTVEIEIKTPVGAIPIEIHTPTKNRVQKKKTITKKKTSNKKRNKKKTKKRGRPKGSKNKIKLQLPGLKKTKRAMREARL